MDTKNSVVVDVSPFLFFEASAGSETQEEGGHEGDDDKGYGNDADQSTGQVTSGSTGFGSVEMDEEVEVVAGEKEDDDDGDAEVNSYRRWPERREDENRTADPSSTVNDERLTRDRMFWEACLAS